MQRALAALELRLLVEGMPGQARQTHGLAAEWLAQAGSLDATAAHHL